MSKATSLLLETARRGELHHALLLHGPDAEQLSTFAIELAKALTCINGTTGDDCVSCQRIDRGIHSDVRRISVADDRKMLSVEQIREVVVEASLKPYESRSKVVIIESAEALSGAAANSLLKTLEEPDSATVFLLLARSPEILLPTIRSRCQMIALRNDGSDTRAADLARIDGVSIELARIRRDAHEIDSDESLTAEMLRLIERFVQRNELTALLALAALVADGENVAKRVGTLVTLLRDLAALPAADSIAPDTFAAVRTKIPPAVLLSAAAEALSGLSTMSVNADPRLQVEKAILSLTKN